MFSHMIIGPCNNRFPHNNRPLPDNPVSQPHARCLCGRTSLMMSDG